MKNIFVKVVLCAAVAFVTVTGCGAQKAAPSNRDSTNAVLTRSAVTTPGNIPDSSSSTTSPSASPNPSPAVFPNPAPNPPAPNPPGR